MGDDGIELLRDKRGDQGVTFADVCDHLEDFRRASPEHAEAIGMLATFLANVEDVRHEHRDGDGATLDPRAAGDIPA